MIVSGSIPVKIVNDTIILQYKNPVRRTLSGEEQVLRKERAKEGTPIWMWSEPSRTSLFGGLILQVSFLELDSVHFVTPKKSVFWLLLIVLYLVRVSCGLVFSSRTLLPSSLSAATAQPTRPRWGGWRREREGEREREI